MKTIKLLLYLSITAFIMIACGRQQEVAEAVSDLVEITNQQFETDSMQLGKIETKLIENVVKCSGTIVPLPNGIAKVNAPIHGWVQSIHIKNGQFVQKNQILMEIGGIEIIDLQKEFAIVSANLNRLKVDYARYKILYSEKATSEKDFIQAEAEYKSVLANYNGLKLKIESIGLSTEKVENGDFSTSYFLKSPINGYINNIKANLGVSVGAQSELLEIVNPEFLQIKLSVFSNDVMKIKIGQDVHIKTGDNDNYFYAKIDAVGVSVDDDTKTITCYASVSEKKSMKPIANMYVEANIITQIDTVTVLPKSAVIKSENTYFILALKNRDSNQYVFTKQVVGIGREYKEYFEILDNEIDGSVLVKGGYYISLSE